MNVRDLIEESKRRRETEQMKQERIARLKSKLPVTRNATITDEDLIDFIHRVFIFSEERLPATFNELATEGVKVIIGDRFPRRDNISLEADGTLFIHHKSSLESIYSFLELTPAKASA